MQRRAAATRDNVRKPHIPPPVGTCNDMIASSPFYHEPAVRGVFIGNAATASAECGINLLNLTTFVAFRLYAHDTTTTLLSALANDHSTPLDTLLAWTQQ
jgi:hypothetical protein